MNGGFWRTVKMPPSELGCPPIRLAHRSVEDDAWRKLACLIHCKRTRELRPQECHKRAAGSPEDVELHKRSADASGFDCHARFGRTGHKERTPWLAGHRSRKDDDE